MPAVAADGHDVPARAVHPAEGRQRRALAVDEAAVLRRVGHPLDEHLVRRVAVVLQRVEGVELAVEAPQVPQGADAEGVAHLVERVVELLGPHLGVVEGAGLVEEAVDTDERLRRQPVVADGLEGLVERRREAVAEDEGQRHEVEAQRVVLGALDAPQPLEPADGGAQVRAPAVGVPRQGAAVDEVDLAVEGELEAQALGLGGDDGGVLLQQRLEHRLEVVLAQGPGRGVVGQLVGPGPGGGAQLRVSGARGQVLEERDGLLPLLDQEVHAAHPPADAVRRLGGEGVQLGGEGEQLGVRRVVDPGGGPGGGRQEQRGQEQPDERGVHVRSSLRCVA